MDPLEITLRSALVQCSSNLELIEKIEKCKKKVNDYLSGMNPNEENEPKEENNLTQQQQKQIIEREPLPEPFDVSQPLSQYLDSVNQFLENH